MLKTNTLKDSRKKQSGAVLAEFSIALIVFLMLIGILFDFGLTYFRYNLLTFSTQKVTRRYAVNLKGQYDAVNMNSLLTSELQSYMEKLDADPNDFSVDNVEIEIEGCGNSPAKYRCYLFSKGVRWKSFSIANLFWNQSFSIQTESRVLIEDPCFLCGASLCPGP